MSQVTLLLGAIQHGDSKAADELLPLIYEELRRLATHKMAHEAPGQTLQPTALVHEAWLRLETGRKHQIRVQAANAGHPPGRRPAFTIPPGGMAGSQRQL